MTRNTNNYLSEKPISVREFDKIVYISLLRVVMPELFSDNNIRRENFRVITRRNIAATYRESYRYRTVQVNMMYKCKTQKVLPVDLGESDRSKLGDYNNWKQAVLEEEKRRAYINPPDSNRLFAQ